MLYSLAKVILFLPFIAHNGGAFAPSGGITSCQRHGFELQSTVVSTEKDVNTLMRRNGRVLDSLATLSGDVSDITRLRFALGFDTASEAKSALREAIAYRSKGRGKAIVEAALDAYETAFIGGGWDNDFVRDAAPHAKLINKFISSKNIVTTSTQSGDLVYVIRASGIDDKAMMDEVSVEQLSEFFMYVKEIHNLVANMRSEQSGRLCEVIFANDIVGVRKPPDARFSKALSSSSSQYAKLYPSLAGPTLITNLPFILQAFVGLFKPLFPKSVQDRLKFVRAPVLAACKDLTPLTGTGTARKNFIAEIDRLLR